MCALTKQNPHHKPLPLNNASAYYSSAQFTQQPLQNIYAHTSTQRPTDRQQLACLFVIALVHKTHTHTHTYTPHTTVTVSHTHTHARQHTIKKGPHAPACLCIGVPIGKPIEKHQLHTQLCYWFATVCALVCLNGEKEIERENRKRVCVCSDTLAQQKNE